jgi:ribosomal protein L44E
MQLKELYVDFDSLDDEGRAGNVRQYRARRATEFEEDQRNYERKQRGTKKRQPALVLSEEEKALIKKMGLTQAQVRMLRAATATEEE